MNEDRVIEKLFEHDKRFDAVDKRFDAVDQRFDAVDKRFDAHDKQLDLLAQKALEHDGKFEKMEGKIDNMDRKISGKQDEIITILRRLDQERIFTASWIQRIEKEVEDHSREISRIKTELKIT